MSLGPLPVFDCSLAFSRLLEGVGSFSPRAENGLVSATAGASRFPAADVRLMPRLDTVKEEGLEKIVFFSFEAKDRVTHSPDSFPGILIECKKLEYGRLSLVDTNVIRV